MPEFHLGGVSFFHSFFSVSSVRDVEANLKLSKAEMWKQYDLPVAEKSYSPASERIVLRIPPRIVLTSPLGR